MSSPTIGRRNVPAESPIDRAKICDRFVTALYVRSGVWSAAYRGPVAIPVSDLPWYGHAVIYGPDFTAEILPTKLQPVRKIVTWGDIVRGLGDMARLVPQDYSDLLTKQDDVDTADLFLQCVVHGTIVESLD